MHTIEKLMSLIKTQSTEDFIESMIVCFAAPVIRGIKCGKLLNLVRRGEDVVFAWENVKDDLLARFSLEAACVPSRGSGLLLFIYDRVLLARALRVEEARSILRDLGYPNLHLKSSKTSLKLREQRDKMLFEKTPSFTSEVRLL